MSTHYLEEREIDCPYCGEAIDVLVDCSIEQQTYVEDCHVCCRPILLSVSVFDGEITIGVRQENE